MCKNFIVYITYVKRSSIYLTLEIIMSIYVAYSPVQFISVASYTHLGKILYAMCLLPVSH